MLKDCSYKSLMTVYVKIYVKKFWNNLCRSQANGNCLLCIFSIAMYGVNRYNDDLGLTTAIELYLTSGFYSEQPSFISMISVDTRYNTSYIRFTSC